MSQNTVIQGYFPGGKPAQPLQRQAAGNPASVGAARRRPPTYRELTLQAHQRSSGLTVQASGGRNAFVVPPQMAGFGRRSGQKLPSAVQQKMESFFNADFSDVQVHSGPEASSIGALAFTMGPNIYFAPGQYNPNSHFGQQLLGHELTHVVQQRAGRVRNPFGSGMAVVQDPALEAEAERMGKQAALHVPVAQSRMAQPGVTQARKAQSPAQPAASAVHLSGPRQVRNGSYKITAQERGRPVGSVMVHKRGQAVEVTDLGVDAAHRGKGFGEKLIGSALRAGLRLGSKRVKLGAGDSGSGKLIRWYRQMGFRQTGLDPGGRPRMEGPISKILSGVAQGCMSPFARESQSMWARVIQRMEEGATGVAEDEEEQEAQTPRRSSRKRTAAVSQLDFVDYGIKVIEHINQQTKDSGSNKAHLLDGIANSIVNQRADGPYKATNVVAVGMNATPRYVVAMNNFQPGDVVAALGNENQQWVRETAGSDDLHAEMRIVEGGQSRTKAIGISKLCCPPCARALQIAKKDFTGCHGLYFDKWAFPVFITGTAANLQAFLGDDVYDDYKDWSGETQKSFIQYLSGNMNTLNKTLKKQK